MSRIPTNVASLADLWLRAVVGDVAHLPAVEAADAFGEGGEVEGVVWGVWGCWCVVVVGGGGGGRVLGERVGGSISVGVRGRRVNGLIIRLYTHT